VLRVGFQNIGGFPLHNNKLKDNAIRCGLSNFDFDIFGMAEINTGWCLQPDTLKLYGRTMGW